MSLRSLLRRRFDARDPWRRPPLPISLLLGYAYVVRDPDGYFGRWLIVVEPDERNFAALEAEAQEAPDP